MSLGEQLTRCEVDAIGVNHCYGNSLQRDIHDAMSRDKEAVDVMKEVTDWLELFLKVKTHEKENENVL